MRWWRRPRPLLPEQLGGARNWDYRYTWVRDGSFSVDALARLGYLDEARAFLTWLGDRVSEQAGGPSGPLKIMYRVDGSSDLKEELLDHFEGYMGSSPVRIGNGAADQLQLDIYGEAIDALARADDIDPIGHEGWCKLRSILDWLAQNWDQPDEGVWETRGWPPAVHLWAGHVLGGYGPGGPDGRAPGATRAYRSMAARSAMPSTTRS